MKRIISILLIIFTITGSVYAIDLTIDNSKNTSLPILSIGIDARSTGMGESMTAVSDDVNALNWNPAGLSDIKRMEFSFTHSQFIADLMYNYIAGAYNFGKAGTIAAGMNILTFGDLKEGMLVDASAYSLVINAGYSIKIIKKLQIGITAKYAIESWKDSQLNDNVSGLSFDIGVLSRIVKGLTIGIVLKNAGFNFSKSKMPLDLRFGSAYKIATDKLVKSIIISGEGVYSTYENFGVRLGVEVVLGNWPRNIQIALRTGFRYPGIGGKSFVNMLDYGLGFSIFNVYADWAMVNSGSSLGSIHRISLSYKFEKTKKSAETKN